jgi:hypothetical protein
MTNLAVDLRVAWGGPIGGGRDYSAPAARRKPRRPAAAAALAVLLLASAGAARAADDAPQPVGDAAAITALLHDHTFYGTYVGNKRPWMEYYAPDGRSAFWVDGCVYRGRWWASGDQACFAYPELSGGDPSCFSVAKHGTAYEFSAPGGDPLVAIADRTAAGNAEHLPLDAGECIGM